MSKVNTPEILSNHQKKFTILRSIQQDPNLSPVKLKQLLRKYPKDNRGYFSKSDLIHAYKKLIGSKDFGKYDPQVIERLRMKPIRTSSGVTPVTVLTKPFPCPGTCIFCPNDVRMPKSYLSSEPGAQRAEKNYFDPYLQTYNRLNAYREIGHNFDKVELIVLGGTWSCYPDNYKRWFIKRCFEALNDFGTSVDQRAAITPSITLDHVKSDHDQLVIDHYSSSVNYNQAVGKLYGDQEIIKRDHGREQASWDEVEHQHKKNESSAVRCVGLVLETRPDYISPKEVIDLRRLGCTKAQIGLQSLQDSVLQKNKRGHNVKASRIAMRLLRQAGLKIHAHWMPNLYGSTPTRDIKDFQKLFSDPDFKPDELKIYPTSLIDHTELMNVYARGKWKPYTHQQLLDVLVSCVTITPEYCRLTRIVRDIPSNDIVVGNKFTNFRQFVDLEADKRHLPINDIRNREVKTSAIDPSKLILKTLCYKTSTSIEYFLQFVTNSNQIAGLLRLSLPTKPTYIKELSDSSIIREVHVYGASLRLGGDIKGAAQHTGLGKKLIKEAEKISLNHNFTRIAVISAIGTREYYQKQGYSLGKLYQTKSF